MDQKYVLFTHSGTTYGLEIDFVENIEKVLKITRVPSSQDIVKGVVNLRGIIVPIVDFGLRVEKETFLTEQSRLMILAVNDMKLGLLVETSSEVIELSEDSLEQPSGVLNNDLVKLLGKSDGRIIQILDINKIFEII